MCCAHLAHVCRLSIVFLTCRRLLSPQLFIGGLVFGNVTTEEGGALVNLLVSRCSGASLEHDLRHTGRLVQLPYGAEIR